MDTTTNDRPPLANGTPVHVRSDHFTGQCNGLITASHYDDGWLYQVDVTSGDHLDEHRNEHGELWVCEFEVQPRRADP